MRTILLLAVCAVLGVGCNDTSKAIEAKCDAPLRNRAEDLAKAQAEGPMEVLGRTEGPIDDKRRRELVKAGAVLGTVTDDLFTARITVSRLGDVASLEFVKSLQLSQSRESMNR